MHYEVFLIDVDDTVLDFHRSALEALKRGFAACKLPYDERMAKEYASFNAELWKRLEVGEITRKYLMENRFHLFLEKMGFTDANGAKFNRAYLKKLSSNPYYIKGARRFLRKVGELGEIYFVTNGTSWIQQSRFNRCGLWEYARGTFISEDLGYDKPSPLFTEAVENGIGGFEKGKVLWIGDSLSSDILAAVEGGIDCVWFSGGKRLPEGAPQPTYIAESYADILKILGIK
ncbi:MAG: HAD hydrolase-like protein [Clostridia bacterium]|nr:HAD hydrolase-like protein [Clostridia bacterium]